MGHSADPARMHSQMNSWLMVLCGRVSQVVLVVKNSTASAGDARDEVRSLAQEEPWKRKWQPTPVFLPERSHGQRSLVGFGP